MVLYRKYRPQKFADLIGQEQIAQTLLAQLASGNLAHAYIFCGPKGTGKTSTARILAKAVNCEVYDPRSTVHGKSANRERVTVNKFGEPCGKCDSCLAVTNGSHLDLIEIDAASNRNIDDVRDIREKIKLSPVSSRYKVYIIDEVHMLTKEAFNALLKTLEEPPSHAIFILCTTEVNKLPSTILSRVQRFNFTRASKSALSLAVRAVAKKEEITVNDEAISAIVSASDGSYRDAISILDQLGSSKKSISEKDITSVAIGSNWNKVYDFCEDIVVGRVIRAVALLDLLWESHADVGYFGNSLVLFLEKLLLLKMGMKPDELDLETEQLDRMDKLASLVTRVDIQNLMKLFMIAEGEMKNYPLEHIPYVLAVSKYTLEKFGDAPFDPSSGKLQEVANSEKQPISDENKVSKAKNSKIKGGFNVDDHWGDLVTRVKAINVHVAAILKSTKPIETLDDILTLGVYFRFHKEKLEEEKILRMIEDIISEMAGTRLRVKFVIQKKENKAPLVVTQSDVVDAGGSELETMAQEIFSK